MFDIFMAQFSQQNTNKTKYNHMISELEFCWKGDATTIGTAN